MLRHAALGFALAEADHKVREEGGQNSGPRVRMYLANCDPPIAVAAPWCAAWVQYVTDYVAKWIRVDNPLNGVPLEGLVQSYWEWGHNNGLLTQAPQAGDLVCFNFNGQRWDHIGIYVAADGGTRFTTVEGNTNEAGSREGDGVFIKQRDSSRYPTAFVRWAT